MDISSDRGSQFTSQLWNAINVSGTTHHCIPANGLVERFHRNLKDALRARLTGPTWSRELPWVLLGIRTAPKEDLKCSAAELVYGIPLTVPGDFLLNPSGPPDQRTHLQQLRECFNSLVPIPTSHHREIPSQVPPNLHQAKFVFVRRDRHHPGLQRPYEGPFEVLESHPKFF